LRLEVAVSFFLERRVRRVGTKLSGVAEVEAEIAQLFSVIFIQAGPVHRLF